MKTKLTWTLNAWQDYCFWQAQDKKTLRRINKLLDSCLRTPFEGIGKPEALKGDLSGFWSRRIDEQHRLVYQPNDSSIIVIACRYHY